MPWGGNNLHFQKVAGAPPYVMQLSKAEEVIQSAKKVAPAAQRALEGQLDLCACGGAVSEGRV